MISSIKGNKQSSAVKDLGCSLPEFKVHIEKQFSSEMSWDNYGYYWEIDHIIPFCGVNLNDIGTQKFVTHYSNMRPITVEDNRKKLKYDMILKQILNSSTNIYW